MLGSLICVCVSARALCVVRGLILVCCSLLVSELCLLFVVLMCVDCSVLFVC